MTRIDFYILPEDAPGGGDPVMTACKLCDKAVAGGLRVYVNAPDPGLQQTLDGTLWTFRQGAFLAHERFDGLAALEEPLPAILVGAAEPPSSHHGVLVNLGDEVPLWFSRFDRVLEFVAGDEPRRAASRLRFKFYRDRGYELATHRL
jgi:DNA polymerase-3 subunit chi